MKNVLWTFFPPWAAKEADLRSVERKQGAD